MRKLIMFVIVVIGAGIGGLYLYYDTLDPCRMAAWEKANDTIRTTSEAFGGDGESIGETMDRLVEDIYRLSLDEKTKGQCTEILIEEWKDNYDEFME